MPSNHLILCHSLLLLPPIPPSMRVFSNESALHMRWPKYWSFSFNISPSKEHPGLISFKMDWLDLLAAQGTLKSLLQLLHYTLQRNPRADLLQNGLVGSLCSPRDSQESSPTPQFKSINSSALSLLHSPTLTSIDDHRKNHSLD